MRHEINASGTPMYLLILGFALLFFLGGVLVGLAV